MQKQGEVDGGLPGGGDARPLLSTGFTGAWSRHLCPPHSRRSRLCGFICGLQHFLRAVQKEKLNEFHWTIK